MNDPDAIIGRADCVFDAATVATAIDRVAVRIALEMTDALPLVVCVMNGGLPFTGQLLQRFEFPLQLDYIHATRYRGTRGGDVVFRSELQNEPSNRTVLLVDDVLDEGHTLVAVAEHVRQMGAAVVRTAVLVDKKVDNRPVTADFVALQGPNRYLVGCGMDYNGLFRNLSSIYALNLDD